MPIANYKPTTTFPENLNTPKTAPDEYKGVVVDDKYHNLQSLTAYVEGYAQTIDYYGQILGEHNDARELDPAQAATYQPYQKVIGLDVRVETPLEFNYDDNTALSNVTGSATMMPGIIPNAYDYFVVKTTRGTPALFRVTDVTRLSMNRDSLYQIDYAMVGYANTGDPKAWVDNLNTKVQKTYYFRSDRLIEGFSPLVKEQENKYIDDLYKQYGDIMTYYFSVFFNRQTKTLLVPGQDGRAYDSFLMSMFLSIVNVSDAAEIQECRILGNDQDPYMLQPQFWKLLQSRNPVYVSACNKTMMLARREEFNRDKYILGAGWYMVNYFVYPSTGDESTRLPGDPGLKEWLYDFVDSTGDDTTFFGTTDNNFTTEDGTVILYKKVLEDTYYVLSEAFYTQSDSQCLLESLVWTYLNGEAVNLSQLYALTAAFYKLPRLEQFYYAPILLTLIQDTRRTQYT